MLIQRKIQLKSRNYWIYLAGGGKMDSFDFDEEGWSECWVSRWWTNNAGDLYYVIATMMGNIGGGMSNLSLPELNATLMHTNLNSNHGINQLREIQFGYSNRTWDNVLGDIVGYSSTTMGLLGNATCNEFYWVGKNGKIYTINQRLKGAQGNYIYNRSYELTKGRMSTLKTIAKISGGICIAVDGIICLQQPTLDNIMNVLMDGVAFIPYVGWICSSTYFIMNQYVISKTGNGIAQNVYDALILTE